MANILISFYQPNIQDDPAKVVCFYEQLAKVFIDSGNKVFLFNMCFMPPDSKKQIDEFNPDLIIAFNNQKCDFLDEYDCPIVIWDADSIEFWRNLEIVKQNIDRYIIFSSTKHQLPHYLKFGAKKNKVFYIPQATILKPKAIEQDKNISIIASNFDIYKFDDVKTYKFEKELLKLYTAVLENEKMDVPYEVKEKINYMHLCLMIDIRRLVLYSIVDLGLTLYGTDWDKLKKSLPLLALVYDETPIFTASDNEYIYNSSKICLNINHPQTHGKSYSWRCMDVMATNGCILTSPTSELIEDTKGYASIPVYTNQFDVREQCKRLLNDDKLRQDIVSGSQAFVREKANLYDRVPLIESITGVKLTDNGVDKGKITYITNYKPKKIKLKNRIRYRMWQYLDKKLKAKGIIPDL